MKKKKDLPARDFLKGIGQAVAERTITRRITREVEPYYHTVKLPRKDDMALDTEVAEWCRSNNLVYDHYEVMKGNGDLVKCSVHVIGKVDVEHWDDVAKRVSLGSSMMEPKIENREFEYKTLYKHMRDASILMSGRHLQHGDVTQPSRNLEVFTNCATSATSFLLFYLLLNGSGVGRSYDNKMMVVDYDKLPIVVPVIDMSHKDVQSGEITIMDLRTAAHFYESKRHSYFEVPDSREGWAKAIEQMEVAAFQGTRTEEVLILDFSKVRARGEPIMGMQGRPASGPGPLISAIQNIAKLRGAGMAPWRAAMYVDHYLAECVLVGGARRAARMATKYWKDLGVLDFASVKRGGFLWSSNNSVMVDEEFWEGVKLGDTRATQVFNLVCSNAYYDQTGEPGLINVDRLDWKPTGAEELYSGEFAGSERFQLDEDTKELTKTLVKAWINGAYKVITNPCVPGDTPILLRGGYENIIDTIGEEVEVWNGFEFSKVTPFHTGFNETVIVKLSNGVDFRCTPTHVFIMKDGSRVEAKDLTPGDSLGKFKMPIVHEGLSYGTQKEAYSQGFYSGDGNTDLNYSWLYFTKYMCEEMLIGRFGEEQDSTPRKTWTHGKMQPKNWVPVDADSDYAVAWLAGLLDADGVVCTNKNSGGSQSFQISNTDYTFLQNVQLLLTRLGVTCKIRGMHAEGNRSMPDGRGGHKEYFCKEISRILIGNAGAETLVNKLSMPIKRLQFSNNNNKSDLSRHVKVVSITPSIACDTYCFTEPLNHSGTFNGVVTSQCSEIVLNSVGGYCVIGDVVPFHADSTQGNAHWDNDAESAFRATARALIRTNLMPGLYHKEVKRTNRIGVGITGFHEWVWARFGMGWKEIVDEEKSKEMWLTLSRFKRGVVEEAEMYSKQLNVNVPHTNTTIKPAGCASLDLEIKTTKDDMTMRELFLLNGVTEEDLARMEDGTWIEPKIPVYVYDKDNRERLVTKLYKNGVKPVYKVTFENGFEAKLTGNHKLMINGEWVRVDCIIDGSLSGNVRIDKVRLTQPELTVDIEVEETHSYQLKNGCVSHNTTSKLFGLTEGAHLPSMREYLRWVQFRTGDPLIEEYEAKGYPIRKLQTYSGTTIVGFPTAPLICQLGMGDKLITAAEATPEEQYQYLKLLEKYWIVGVEEDGVTPLPDTGNQVSYTLKYNPSIVSFEEFKSTLLEGQASIRCCSVMPQTDATAYEYQPEQPLSKHEYEIICQALKEEDGKETKEDIGLEHVDCATGACPVNFRSE